MAATIEQLLVNNPNWSYVEIGVAYIAWDAAIKYMEAKFTSTNKPSMPVCPSWSKDTSSGEWGCLKGKPAHVG